MTTEVDEIDSVDEMAAPSLVPQRENKDGACGPASGRVGPKPGRSGLDTETEADGASRWAPEAGAQPAIYATPWGRLPAEIAPDDER